MPLGLLAKLPAPLRDIEATRFLPRSLLGICRLAEGRGEAWALLGFDGNRYREWHGGMSAARLGRAAPAYGAGCLLLRAVASVCAGGEVSVDGLTPSVSMNALTNVAATCGTIELPMARSLATLLDIPGAKS